MSAEILFGGKTATSYIIDNSFDEKEKQTLFDIDSEESFGFLERLCTPVVGACGCRCAPAATCLALVL